MSEDILEQPHSGVFNACNHSAFDDLTVEWYDVREQNVRQRFFTFDSYRGNGVGNMYKLTYNVKTGECTNECAQIDSLTQLVNASRLELFFGAENE